MAALSAMLADLTARELDANEQALAACFGQPPELTAEARQLLTPFLAWCEQQRVRPLPAKPTSVAAFAQLQIDQRIPRDSLHATLSAIEQLHFAAAMANPVAVPVVRTVTGSTIDPPRSWRAEEKLMFTGLPPEIASVIARREQDRERELRKAQNAAAEAKRLKADAATTSAANTTKESTQDNG